MSLIVLMLASCTTEEARPFGGPYSPENSAVDGRKCLVPGYFLGLQILHMRWFEEEGIDLSDIDAEGDCSTDERILGVTEIRDQGIVPNMSFERACDDLMFIKEAASCCTEVGATHVGWKTSEKSLLNSANPMTASLPICR